ncbi:hypothetical protein EDD21DRAFT_162264 [Dissophora ornata]|nr:hypothetical protein EDD21DRAFT_162264 [Dissophora ornata]
MRFFPFLFSSFCSFYFLIPHLPPSPNNRPRNKPCKSFNLVFFRFILSCTPRSLTWPICWLSCSTDQTNHPNQFLLNNQEKNPRADSHAWTFMLNLLQLLPSLYISLWFFFQASFSAKSPSYFTKEQQHQQHQP